MARMNLKEAAAFIPLAVGTLNNKRVSGDGPTYIKLGGRVLYEEGDIAKWIELHKQKSTSQNGPRATRRTS